MKISFVLLLGLLLVSISSDAKKKWIQDLDDLLDDAVDYLDENSQDIDDAINNIVDAAKQDKDSAKIVTKYFKRLVDEHDVGALPIKNTTCITRHCTGQISSCIGD